jgi:hypothetical protein
MSGPPLARGAVVMSCGRLESMSEPASDPEAVGVTFATLRERAEGTIKLADDAKAGRMSPLSGARSAARDVLAILGKHGAPPNEPVHFGDGSG